MHRCNTAGDRSVLPPVRMSTSGCEKSELAKISDISHIQGSHCSHRIKFEDLLKFKDLSRTPNINFQGLNVDISSHHYTLCVISLTVKLHAIKWQPHQNIANILIYR